MLLMITLKNRRKTEFVMCLSDILNNFCDFFVVHASKTLGIEYETFGLVEGDFFSWCFLLII